MNRLTTADPNPAEVRRTLEQVLSSAAFRSSKRSQEFLRFVVERTIAGQVDEVRERTIGVELFGRSPDYNTHEDSIVRVKANEIRKRLAQYYQEEGASDNLQIILPAGSYTPEFRVLIPAPPVDSGTETMAPPERSKSRRVRAVLAFLALGLLILLVYWISHPSSNLEKFWEPMLSTEDTVLFYMGQSVSYQLSRRVQDEYLRKNPQLLKTLEVYTIPFNEGFHLLPGDIVTLRDLTVSTGEATAIANIGSILRQRNRKFELKFGPVAPGEGRAPVAVLVGAFNNPWTIAATRELRFHFARELTEQGASWSINDRVSGKSWKLWNVHPVQDNTLDYALVTRLIDPNGSSMTVAIGGITQFGTEAASQLISSVHGLDQVAVRAPSGWEKKNLQIVLQTSVVGRAAVNPEVLFVHAW